MDSQSENPGEARGEPVVTGLAPLETDEVPDSMVADFSSLTTPYCFVITEELARSSFDTDFTTAYARSRELVQQCLDTADAAEARAAWPRRHK